MAEDLRQFEVKEIMDTKVPVNIRRNYEAMKAQGKTFGITRREHSLWNAQYPMVGELRSMIAGTDFKPPEFSPKHIPLNREQPVIKKKKEKK